MKTAALSLAAAFAAIAHSGTAQAAERQAIFAGGCFWCIEKDFEAVPGVVDVVSGYTGGSNDTPTYKNHTKFGHREVVRITYDDATIDYPTLLSMFFRSVDPTDGGGQFCDRGHSYTTAVYALDDEQRAAAETAKEEAQSVLNQPIATEITAAAPFTPAEDYHQNYYEKAPIRYRYYRYRCGRDQRVKALWGKEAYRGFKKDDKTG